MHVYLSVMCLVVSYWEFCIKDVQEGRKDSESDVGMWLSVVKSIM